MELISLLSENSLRKKTSSSKSSASGRVRPSFKEEVFEVYGEKGK